jgi:uncharacterized membrane protein
MDPAVRALLAVLMRWIHITSVVTLIGGFIFARYTLAPALAALPDPERRTLGNRVVAGFRPLLYTVLVTVLGSGLYNYLTKPSYPPHYHMWIGIKFLLVLHIFAVAILYANRDADEAKRNRWLAGIVGSGLIVIAISAYLRWISFA